MAKMERYWINQPSTLQPNHKLHGINVLADIHEEGDYCRCYFLSGAGISQQIAKLSLSKGWNI